MPLTERLVGESHLRPLSETEQRHKDAVIQKLRDMKFRAISLALDNLGGLVRESDWDPYETEINSRGPFGFFKWHLEGERDFLSDDPPDRLSDPQIEAEAWAMALRYDIECLIEATSESIENGVKSLSYLGPLRYVPQRHILETDEFDASWVAAGGEAWQRLRKEPAVVEKVNRFLRETLRSRYTIQTRSFARQLDAATLERCIRAAMERANDVPSTTETDELVTARVAEDAPLSASKTRSSENLAATLKAELSSQNAGETLTELQLFDSEAGIEVSHRDVGTGISQLLPVIVNAVAAQEKLIAIEQPELHLHPALQAELGDLFIESAIGENKNVFLIETHSEHLLLRIMRRMRNTAEGTLPEGAKPLTPNHVALALRVARRAGKCRSRHRSQRTWRTCEGMAGRIFRRGLGECSADMLSELALGPEVFRTDEYGDVAFADVCLAQFRAAMFEDFVVRDLRMGGWHAYVLAQEERLHPKGKELLKKLKSQERLISHVPFLPASPQASVRYRIAA